MRAALLCWLLAKTAVTAAVCKEWCQDSPCCSLNGDVMQECSGCGDDAICKPGALGYMSVRSKAAQDEKAKACEGFVDPRGSGPNNPGLGSAGPMDGDSGMDDDYFDALLKDLGEDEDAGENAESSEPPRQQESAQLEEPPSASAGGRTAQCESWCQDSPCCALKGDVTQECSGCGDDAVCKPGAVGYVAVRSKATQDEKEYACLGFVDPRGSGRSDPGPMDGDSGMDDDYFDALLEDLGEDGDTKSNEPPPQQESAQREEPPSASNDDVMLDAILDEVANEGGADATTSTAGKAADSTTDDDYFDALLEDLGEDGDTKSNEPPPQQESAQREEPPSASNDDVMLDAILDEVANEGGADATTSTAGKAADSTTDDEYFDALLEELEDDIIHSSPPSTAAQMVNPSTAAEQLVNTGRFSNNIKNNKCESWCSDDCCRLNGDVTFECVGCSEEYNCRPGSKGYHTLRTAEGKAAKEDACGYLAERPAEGTMGPRNPSDGFDGPTAGSGEGAADEELDALMDDLLGDDEL